MLRLSISGRRCRSFDGAGMTKPEKPDIALCARMLSAMGTEPRLRIMRLLLSAHPRGMIVMDIQATRYSGPHTVAPPREAQKRGPGQGSEAALLLPVLCKHRNPAGAAGISILRMLFERWRRQRRESLPNCQIDGVLLNLCPSPVAYQGERLK